jgi:putative transcriptional regulator
MFIFASTARKNKHLLLIGMLQVNISKEVLLKNRLEEFRNLKQWTQQELANRVLVSRQTIISLENGRYNPSILLAFRLARLFNVTIEELFLYTGEEEDQNG